MLSVLISVYNYDPSWLVEDLLPQLNSSKQDFEIIIGNDCSDSNFMPLFESLGTNPNVKIFNSDVNIGRAAMRNRLAEISVNSFLLYIDGDARVTSDDFISQYLDNADSKTVICGGTAYRDKKPPAHEGYLRWLYGIEREARSAEERNKSPHRGFSSFNFLVPKEIFLSIRFREDLTRYGHEDTLFGMDLSLKGIKVVHIDNPLFHEGLDSADVFLSKTRSSIKNLVYLEENISNPDLLADSVRLLNQYNKLKKTGLHHLLRLTHKPLLSFLTRRLSGKAPKIRYLDLYKLCLLNRYKY